MSTAQTTLYYFHDPMCSWCWGFSAAFQRLQDSLPASVQVRRILGGLAADNDEPMPDDMRDYIRANWKKIEQNIPGVAFNFDFWETCQPRRSTYPACRAVIAARLQGEQYDRLMTSAIQQAYYQQARNPSDNATLQELAAELGLDVERFTRDLSSEQVENQLQQEIGLTQEMFVESFPSLVLVHNGRHHLVVIDYNDHQVMLDAIHHYLSESE